MYLLITLIVLAGLLMLIYPNIKIKNLSFQDKNMIDMTTNEPKEEVKLEAGRQETTPLLPIAPRLPNKQHLRHLEKKMITGHIRNRIARKSRQTNRRVNS